jgi:hypothetical protein
VPAVPIDSSSGWAWKLTMVPTAGDPIRGPRGPARRSQVR